MRLNQLSGGPAALVYLLAVAAAQASSMPVLSDAVYYEALTVGPYNNPTATYTGDPSANAQLPCFQATGSPVCATTIFNADSTISVTASITAYSGQFNSVFAELAYYYEVVGPDGVPVNFPVPLQITGLVSYTYSIGQYASIPGQNFADVTVTGQASNGATISVTDNSQATVPANVFTLNINAWVGSQNEVILRAVGNLYNYGDSTPDTLTAIADPVISFAPGFNSTGYSIVTSPAIPNGVAATAPEPASFGLAGSALAAFLFAFSRKRAGWFRDSIN